MEKYFAKVKDNIRLSPEKEKESIGFQGGSSVCPEEENKIMRDMSHSAEGGLVGEQDTERRLEAERRKRVLEKWTIAASLSSARERKLAKGGSRKTGESSRKGRPKGLEEQRREQRKEHQQVEENDLEVELKDKVDHRGKV